MKTDISSLDYGKLFVGGIEHAKNALHHVHEMKYGPAGQQGWGPLLRKKFQYSTPDDIYEALVYTCVSEDTEWLDVGCGRDIFPSNRPLAGLLSKRCKDLVGLDPDDNIDENPFIHKREKGLIEDFITEKQFDLITMRMVVEHVSHPARVVENLANLVKTGGTVVVYTVSKWSIISIIARITPTWFHRLAKRIIWRTKDSDTFPVMYKMNTRNELKRLFERAGFLEINFSRLDDCRTFYRWKCMQFLELSLWKALRAVGLPYPETCILTVYRKQ